MALVTYNDIDALGERYFDVFIYKYEEEIEDVYESFTCYGNVWDIASMMDSIYLINEAPHDEWSRYTACISYLGHDLVALTNLADPGEYYIIADYEILEQLAAA